MSKRNHATQRSPTQTQRPVPHGSDATTDGWAPSWPVAGLIFLGLAIVYFLPAFLPGRQVYGSDFLAGAYPVHEFLSARFSAWSLPKWIPHLYGGLPIFANAGSTYHPFRFIGDLLFAPHRIFPTIYVLQFALAGLGAYLLSVELGTRRWVALIAGLAFQFTGITMSYVLGGHEGRIIVATLTPLFLFFLHRGVRTGSVVWFAGAALTMGSALLSFQIQSSYYLLWLGAAWGVFAIVQTGVRGWRPVSGRVALGLGAVAVAFGMAAVNFLPFMDYVDQSPRGEGGRGYEYATSWAMPVAEIVGVVLPEQAGVLDQYQGTNPFKLHTEYVGAVVGLLVLLGLYYNRRERYWWFFLGATLVALTFAFGGNTPIYRIYYELLPGTRQFRAPSISFFVVSASLVMMAALTLERLASLRDGQREGRGDSDWDRPALYMIGGAGVLALLVLLVSGSAEGEHGRQLAAGALRVALVTWLAGLALWAWLRHSLPTTALVAALSILTVADLWVVDRAFFRTVDGPEFLYASDEVVDFLQSQPERSRIWVLPPELQGGQAYGGGLRNYLMHFDLDQAAGEHGNQLHRYNEYLGAGEQTYVDWHNVLGDLQVLVGADDSATAGSPTFLRAANIRYIISMTQLPGLPLVFQGRTGLVYEVPGALPRAYLVGDAMVAETTESALAILSDPTFDPAATAVVDRPLDRPLNGPADASSAGPRTPEPAGAAGDPAAADRIAAVDRSASLEVYEADRVVVRTRAETDALLVLADNYYEGWQATVDGEPVPVLRANHAFRGVRVPAGEHEVVFEFRPTDVYAGLAISGGAVLLALAALGGGLIQDRRRRAGSAPSGSSADRPSSSSDTDEA